MTPDWIGLAAVPTSKTGEFEGVRRRVVGLGDVIDVAQARVAGRLQDGRRVRLVADVWRTKVNGSHVPRLAGRVGGLDPDRV